MILSPISDKTLQWFWNVQQHNQIWVQFCKIKVESCLGVSFFETFLGEMSPYLLVLVSACSSKRQFYSLIFFKGLPEFSVSLWQHAFLWDLIKRSDLYEHLFWAILSDIFCFQFDCSQLMIVVFRIAWQLLTIYQRTSGSIFFWQNRLGDLDLERVDVSWRHFFKVKINPKLVAMQLIWQCSIIICDLYIASPRFDVRFYKPGWTSKRHPPLTPDGGVV